MARGKQEKTEINWFSHLESIIKIFFGVVGGILALITFYSFLPISSNIEDIKIVIKIIIITIVLLLVAILYILREMMKR